jgi:hypothetical protein
MTTTCFVPLLGKRIRVTALDSCANLPAGGTVDQVVTTDGFISVSLSAEIEDGAEIITKKADGSLCVNEKLESSFKRFTVGIEFCGVNPSLLALVSHAKTYTDWTVGNVAGFTVPEGQITKNFALELWTGVSGAACLPGAAFLGGYALLPYVRSGVLGDVTVDGANAVSFSLKGAYTRGGNTWSTGPYQVLLNASSVPAQLPTAIDPFDHLLLVQTSLAPPASACSPTPMPPYITTITPATGLAAGGTATVILGSGFTTATAVNFGATPGTSFSVVNDGRITVTSPAHATGTVDVTVVRPGGNAVKTGGFIYT